MKKKTQGKQLKRTTVKGLISKLFRMPPRLPVEFVVINRDPSTEEMLIVRVYDGVDIDVMDFQDYKGSRVRIFVNNYD